MTIRNAASKCICSCKEINLNYAAAPCSLNIELLSNALRHAFSDGLGAVGIELDKEETGQIRVRVKDDGCGIPAEVDIERPSTLGLMMITTLATQLGGEIAGNEIKGTSFELRFRARSDA
jgi:two-component sensor histidine kinase